MRNDISDKLIQNLSLYLDKELSFDEMKEIEELLRMDPEVFKTFDSLKRTREVLRNTPKISRRRSFTLSAEDAKQVKKQNGFLNGMRLVSSFSMILLLVVFTQNLLGDWSPLTSMNMVNNDIASYADEADSQEMDYSVDEIEKAVDSDEEDTVSDLAGDNADEAVDDAMSFDADAPEMSDEDVKDCSIEEVCVDTMSESTDDSTEAERTLSPDDAVGGGITPAEAIPVAEEDDSAVVLETPVVEPIQEGDEIISVATEVAIEKVATAGVEAVIEDSTIGEENEMGKLDAEEIIEKDFTLLVVLVAFSVFSSGIYLFLKKKFN